MTRNLKALGLALIATFAMSAVVVSAARAEVTLTPAQYPAVLTATALNTQVYVTNTGQEILCTGVSGHSTIEQPGVGDTTITVTDYKYSGCSAKIGASTLPMTIDMNGCDLQFHGGTDTGGGHFVNATSTLSGCTGTGPSITIFANHTAHTENKPLCTLTVWSTVTSGTVTITNTAGSPNDIDVKSTGVTNNVTRDGSIICGNPATAVYNGEITVEAFEDLGVHGSTPTEGAQIGLTASTS